MNHSSYVCGYKATPKPTPLPLLILGYFLVAATLAVALVG